MFKNFSLLITYVSILCILLAWVGKVSADDDKERISRLEELARRAILRQYASDMALAQIAWQMGKLDRAISLLERHRPKDSEDDHRSIEWYLLWRMMHAEKATLVGESSPIAAIAFSADDSELIFTQRSFTYHTPAMVKTWKPEPSHLAESAPLQPQNKQPNTASSMLVWEQERQETNAYYFGGHTLALSADASRIAIPDNQSIQVILRDTGQTTGKVEWTLGGHADFVEAVAMSLDGSRLATGGLDKRLNVWNLDTGELIESLPGHELGVLAVAFSPDGKTIAAGGGDSRAPDWHRRQHGELKIWTVQSDNEPHTVEVSAAVTSVTYSANGQYIAASLFDGKTIVVDARANKILRTITSSSTVTCVRFSPDSNHLATASTDGQVKLWDRQTGDEIATFRGHRGRVECLAFSPSGLWLASGGVDQTLRVWDMSLYPERTRIALPAWSIHTVAFTDKGQSLMASDFNQVWLVDPNSSRVRAHWNSDHWVIAAAISYDGSRIATAGQRSTHGGGGAFVRLWNPTDTSKPQEVSVPLGSADSVAFTRDGKYLLVHCESADKSESSVRLYSSDTGSLQEAWDAAYTAALSADSRLVAIGLAEAIVLYDLESKKELARITGDEARSNNLQFSPDSKHLASSSFDHSVYIWKTANQELAKVLRHPQQVATHVVFSPDGKNVVTSDAEQSYVWDFSDATIRYPLPCGSCPMVFSPDSRTLIAAPGEVLFLQVATGDELITFPHYGYDSRTLAITPDGKIIAQAGGNRDESNGIWIWNAKNAD